MLTRRGLLRRGIELLSGVGMLGLLVKHVDAGPLAKRQPLDPGPREATWLGAVSNDWYDGRNWSGGAVPGPDTNVIVLTPGRPILMISSLTVQDEANRPRFSFS